jgi:hypothetical protein
MPFAPSPPVRWRLAHVTSEATNGGKRRVQLTRDRTAYVVRYVVRAGSESNAETVEAFQLAAAKMSRELFDGQTVEVHLCDQGLQTLRVVTSAG